MTVSPKWLFFAGVIAIASPCFGGPAIAKDLSEPLQIRNTSPLAQLYGIAEFRGSKRDQLEARFDVSAANSFTVGASAGEFVRLDGETAVFSYQLSRGFGRRFEAGIAASWVTHSGGRFDGLIDGFHDLFGFPNGGRPAVPRGNLNYFIQDGSQGGNGVALDLVGKNTDLGDFRLWVGYELWERPGASIVARAQVKLPTGSTRQLTGSGATDVALNVDYVGQWLRPYLSVSLGAGVVRMGLGELLPQRQRRTLWTGHFGLTARVSPAVSFIGQLDAHAALFDSGTSQLGDAVLQGTLGGRIRVTPALDVELAVVEDLSGALAADVIFQVALEGRF